MTIRSKTFIDSDGDTISVGTVDEDVFIRCVQDDGCESVSQAVVQLSVEEAKYLRKALKKFIKRAESARENL